MKRQYSNQNDLINEDNDNHPFMGMINTIIAQNKQLSKSIRLYSSESSLMGDRANPCEDQFIHRLKDEFVLPTDINFHPPDILNDLKKEQIQIERKTSKVESIPHIKKMTCCICFQNLTHTTYSIMIPCFHEFCYNCILKWTKKNNTCPLCRTKCECFLYSIRSSDVYEIKYIHINQDIHDLKNVLNLDTKEKANYNYDIKEVRQKYVDINIKYHQVFGDSSKLSPASLNAPSVVDTESKKNEHTNQYLFPKARVFINDKKEYECTIMETNRIRKLLHMKPLYT
ncbi:hypothetical protein WA158_006552 [Blastocystis sp. Blastoise]